LALGSGGLRLWDCRKANVFSAASSGLELHHRQAGDALEVAQIIGQHFEAERQCRGSDEQVTVVRDAGHALTSYIGYN